MAEVRDYVWLFPLTGGIIALISLVTPAVSVTLMGLISGSLWFWGLYTYNYGGMYYGTEFVMDSLVLIPSLITTCLLVIGAVLLLVAALNLRRKNLQQVKIGTLSILGGAVILVALLLWLFTVPTFFPLQTYYPGYPGTFWNYIGNSFHSVGFGIIGGFLSAIISFVGAGAARYYSKERVVTIPKEKKIMPSTGEQKPQLKSELKYCPECGAKIEDPNTKFCGKCKFQFKTPEQSSL